MDQVCGGSFWGWVEGSYGFSIFPFQNNPKDLDLFCKTDLDLWDSLGRVKLLL